MKTKSLYLALFFGLISSCASAQWVRTNGPDSTNVRALAVNGTSLFAGTSSGVFLSTNNGTNWTETSTGLTNRGVWALAVSGTNLFAGTRDGVWRRSLSDFVTAVETLPGQPTVVALVQNYPNPFNPSTTIKFELPTSSEVRLSVFDMLGREVSVLVNESRDAGVHGVKFDRSNLSSGVYFYRMQAGEFSQTRKRVVLR